MYFECHWHMVLSNGHNIYTPFPNTFLDIVCRVRITFTIHDVLSCKEIYL